MKGIRGIKTVSKTKAQTIVNANSDDFEHELDETVPLPTLPMLSNMSIGAANDESFAGQGRNENIERLIALAESIDNHLKVIADAAVALKPKSPQSRKTKKRIVKKRTAKKRVAKQGASKKSATEKCTTAQSA